MAVGPITTADFRDHVMPQLIDRIDSNLKRRLKNAEWKKLFRSDSTDREVLESRQYEAAGPARQMNEAAVHPLIRLEDGWSKRIAQTQYGAKVEYTSRARLFVKTDLIARSTQELPAACDKLLESLAQSYIEYGDTALASVPTVNNTPVIDSICGDGNPIFYNAHTFKSDATNTYSNVQSHTSLTQSALQTICTAIHRWKENSGEYLDVEPVRLIVPPDLQWKAYELLHSETKSETAERSDNALRQAFGRFDFWVYRHMVATTEYLVETNWPNDYRFVFGMKPKTTRGENEDTGVFSVYIDMYLAHGVNDPRRLYADKV